MGAARTLEHALAAYSLDGCYDEAFEPSGAPRPAYETLLAHLDSAPLSRLADAVAAEVEALGVVWGSGRGRSPFLLDPIPRIIAAAEWELVERGLEQRARALGEFTADVHGERRVVSAGVVPARAIESAGYFEPWMMGVEVPAWTYVAVTGVDLVRDGEGRLLVLEDNVRTPSGLSFASAARRAADGHLPCSPPPGRRSLAGAYEALGRALREAAPAGVDDPLAVLLSDGPSNSAWYEHRELARRLGVPLVTPGDLYTRAGGRLYAWLGSQSRRVDVVYRRTDEDRLRDEHGNPTWIADLLLDPCRSGRASIINAFGSGVADDKLLHSYVDDMIPFYLGEEPVVGSVPSFDLSDPFTRAEALAHVGDLVLKPRSGHGGTGIVIGAHATPGQRAEIARRVEARPNDWVAQETVELSRHPTIADGALEPRHVDLRAFVISARDRVVVAAGGLTRFAPNPQTLVVNSSQGGGGKDTWVLR